MKIITKNELVAHVMNLNSIIRFINEENCYNNVVEFFKITSDLQDRSEEIRELLPSVEGTKFCCWKSAKRKHSEAIRLNAENGLNTFMSEINKAGRDLYGHNRTQPGKIVTKDNLYFGDIAGIHTFTIRRFENEFKDEEDVQKVIRNQIVCFVRSYKDSFKTDWLN